MTSAPKEDKKSSSQYEEGWRTGCEERWRREDKSFSMKDSLVFFNSRIHSTPSMMRRRMAMMMISKSDVGKSNRIDGQFDIRVGSVENNEICKKRRKSDEDLVMRSRESELRVKVLNTWRRVMRREWKCSVLILEIQVLLVSFGMMILSTASPLVSSTADHHPQDSAFGEEWVKSWKEERRNDQTERETLLDWTAVDN